METLVRALLGLVITCTLAALLVFYFVQATPSVFIILAISAGVALIPLLILRPEIGLMLLIGLRNSIDIFDRSDIVLGGLSLNLASLLGILVLPWAGIVILRELSHRPEGILRSFISLPLIPLWLGLLVFSVISFTQSASLTESIIQLIKLLNYAAFYMVGVTLAHRIGVRKMFAIIAGSLVIPSIFGIYQFIAPTADIVSEIGNRLHGTFAHPNAFAFTLVLAVVSTITLFTTARASRMLWVVLGVTFFTMLLLTYTRSAWVGIASAGLIWLFGYYRKLILPTIAVLALIVFSFPALATYTQNSFGIHLEDTSLVKRAGISEDESTESFAWRTRTWKETLPAVWERPITGHGIGTFPLVRQRFIGFETDLRALEAHNDYLRLVVEIGIVGLVLYLLLFTRIVRLLMHRLTHSAQAQPYLVGYAAIVIAMLIMSFSDNILRNAPVQWMFWSLTGVMVAAITTSRYTTRNNSLT